MSEPDTGGPREIRAGDGKSSLAGLDRVSAVMVCNRLSLRLVYCGFLAATFLPAVTVTGPIASTTPLRDPAHGYPYNATPIDLAKKGYVEEEVFLEGQANS